MTLGGRTASPKIRMSDIRAAIGFLTILPVGLGDDPDRGIGSSWAWPLVGAALGAIAGVVAFLASLSGAPAGVAAILAIAVLVLMTGAFHEDGLADAADGLFAGKDRESRLAIMKDSRLGTFGVVALCLCLIARWYGIMTLEAYSSAVWALVASCAISRSAMLFWMVAVAPARRSGLSATLGKPSGAALVAGCSIAIAISIAALGWRAFPVLVIAALASGMFCWFVFVRIRGQTGDTLGATQQCAETACILFLCSIV